MTNPDMSRQLMNHPLVQNLMSNPEYLRTMLTSNPQMQQLIDRNPELNHLLNNPEVLRQTMEMMRNPAAFQEMMRSQDRALSNLESLPGGYNALRRMYTELQEPMLNAAQEQIVGDNPFASFLNQGSQRSSTNVDSANTQAGTENRDPLPNPWSRDAPATNRGSGVGTTATTDNSASTGTGAGGRSADMFNSRGMQSLMTQMLENTNLMSSVMDSPYMQQMVGQLSTNPQLMQQMMATNPLLADNPALQEQMRELLPNMVQQMGSPEVRQSLSDPATLEAILQIQRGMAQLQRVAPDLLGTMK